MWLPDCNYRPQLLNTLCTYARYVYAYVKYKAFSVNDVIIMGIIKKIQMAAKLRIHVTVGKFG